MGEAGEIISVDGKLTTVKGLSNKTKRVTLSDSSLMPGDEIAIPNPTQDRYEVRRLYRRAMLEDIHSGYLVTSDGDEIIAPSVLRDRGGIALVKRRTLIRRIVGTVMLMFGSYVTLFDILQ